MEKLTKMMDGDERQINRITRLIDDMLEILKCWNILLYRLMYNTVLNKFDNYSFFLIL